MVFSTPERDSHSDDVTPAKNPATGFMGTFTALAALCARVTKKLRNKSCPSHKSSINKPKQLLKTLIHKKKNGGGDGGVSKEEEEIEWGDGGVWQRSIMMGDKCQPLDFSGVIYYDSNGTQTNEVPLRSPRASPLPGYLSRQTKT